MARTTWLYRCIDQAVIEQTVLHSERRNGVANIAVNACSLGVRMAGYRASRINTMAGIATFTENIRAGMVRVGASESCRGVAVTALGGGSVMRRRIGLACGDNAIMAGRT